MAERLPIKVSNKRAEKCMIKKLIQNLKIIFALILYDSKINGKKFSS